jgi:hypothetical protein
MDRTCDAIIDASLLFKLCWTAWRILTPANSLRRHATRAGA